jgi:hypothetical protein
MTRDKHLEDFVTGLTVYDDGSAKYYSATQQNGHGTLSFSAICRPSQGYLYIQTLNWTPTQEREQSWLGRVLGHSNDPRADAYRLLERQLPTDVSSVVLHTDDESYWKKHGFRPQTKSDRAQFYWANAHEGIVVKHLKRKPRT